MTHTANQVTITPEIAREWLARSNGNRHISAGWVAKIKADILSGSWKCNGDRIRFLPDGTLYDGHHRLTACVEAGKPIISDTFVMQEDAKATVDKGRARSTADLLAMESGVAAQKSSSIAAAIRIMTTHDNTNLSDWARPIGGSYGAEFHTEQALQKYYLDRKQVIDEACEWVHENVRKQNTLISKSHAIAFLCLSQREYGKEDSYKYLHSVLTGYEVEPGTTADHIRNALLAVKMKQRKMTPQHKMYSVIKGFKSIMSGRNIKHAGNATFRPSVDNCPRFEVK